MVWQFLCFKRTNKTLFPKLNYSLLKFRFNLFFYQMILLLLFIECLPTEEHGIDIENYRSLKCKHGLGNKDIKV